MRLFLQEPFVRHHLAVLLGKLGFSLRLRHRGGRLAKFPVRAWGGPLLQRGSRKDSVSKKASEKHILYVWTLYWALLPVMLSEEACNQERWIPAAPN